VQATYWDAVGCVRRNGVVTNIGSGGDNDVLSNNNGAFNRGNGGVGVVIASEAWVQPCPSSAVCGWLRDARTGNAFCAADQRYARPQ
jgi:hypothetical protein